MKFRLVFFLLLPALAQAQAPKTYFQQRVDTRMQVNLDDDRHFLHGHQELTYTNNSPDTLRELYIHLWPNAYKHDRTAFSEQQLGNDKTDFYFSKAADRGYIDSLAFQVNGQPVSYFSADATPDIARIDLPAPLLPGASLELTTPFRVKIPKVYSRLGHTGQAYFISQWFPKPAVYDQEGWHPMPYLDQGEFYAEPGRYTVDITLPENYVLLATGNLESPEEQHFMDSLAWMPDSAYKKAGNTTPKSSALTKTVRYTEDNIHDFAWFADKRFMVRKDSFLQDGGPTVHTWVGFLPTDSAYWKNGNAYLKAALKTYGKNLGTYPYRTIKAVEGDMKAGGGMEYPTITVIDRNVSPALKSVVIHEAGHNWFQGILASNERQYPWLDEGMNTFYEWKTVAEYDAEEARQKTQKADSSGRKAVPRSRNDFREQEQEAQLYYQLARTGEDQALDLSSTDYRYLNYGGDVYMKTALWMRWLEAWMGEGDFQKAMQEYYATWKFRHPTPADLMAILRKHSSKDLSWFADHAFTETRPVDFSLRKNRNEVLVTNRNAFAAPALVNFYAGDSVVHQSWTPVFTGTTSLPLPALAYDQVALSPSLPDARPFNNTPKRPVEIGLAGGFERRTTTKIYLSPALGYNSYDGLMAGLLVQNIFKFPESPFRFAVAPLYSLRTKSFTGAASLGYFWYPRSGPFREMGLQIDAKTFHHKESGLNAPDLLFARYIKVAPELSALLRERNPRSPVERLLRLRGYAIREEDFDFVQDPTDSLFRPRLTTRTTPYFLVGYQHRNRRAINPFSYSLEAHGNADFVKLLAEAQIRIDYHRKNQGLTVRAFAGKMLVPAGEQIARRYALQSTYTGINDYLYDGTYLGRNEQDGIAAHQIGIREGGLKVPTPYYSNPLGASDNWLAALNLTTTVPLGKRRFPFELFFDVATFANAAESNPSGNKVLYDGGILLRLPGNILTVYYPMLLSPDLKDYYRSVHGNAGIGKTLMVNVQLQGLNWLRFTRKAMRSLL